MGASRQSIASSATRAAISAPTALAISLAERANLTLVGFARDDGQAVYAHGHRLLPPDGLESAVGAGGMA